jgi:bacteriorhodopsin
MEGLYETFHLTYVLLLTTATVTFIEALRTKTPMIRHILNLETCISVVASYFYSVFLEKIKGPYTWPELTKIRYLDWAITTPLMLLALCLALVYNVGSHLNLSLILTIVALNYTMLAVGYLGETNGLPRLQASVIGFIPFFFMFWLIYGLVGKSLANKVLFGLYFVVWSMYGLVYLLDEEAKQISVNILDLIAKCLIGLGLWAYYTHIVYTDAAV